MRCSIDHVSTPLIAGVDLSLTSTGIALSTGHLHRIQSKGKATATLADRERRLFDLALRIGETVGYPDLMVIEAPSYGNASRGNPTHDRSGLWWWVVSEASDRGITVVEVPPSCRAKYATGKGNASKDAVLAAVVRRFPDWDVSGNDVADALVLCAMGCDATGHPLVEMPALHRAALTTIGWPM